MTIEKQAMWLLCELNHLKACVGQEHVQAQLLLIAKMLRNAKADGMNEIADLMFNNTTAAVIRAAAQKVRDGE